MDRLGQGELSPHDSRQTMPTQILLLVLNTRVSQLWNQQHSCHSTHPHGFIPIAGGAEAPPTTKRPHPLPENPEKLIYLRVSMKQRLLGGQFSKDGPCAPDVNGGGVSG